jgi:hypothetical protein
LGRQVFVLLNDYTKQKRKGLDPVFKKSEVKEFADNDAIDCW